MKRVMKFLMLAACLVCARTSVVQAQTAVTGPITYNDFYSALEPYGTWIDYPEYGHVWRFTGDKNFRPYATNGHWEHTDQGWYWASNYTWGWAPFHYGSWLYDQNYGWLWVPGYEWAPAWVTWGDIGDDYLAWAPLMAGIDTERSYGSWAPHDYYWNVVPSGDFLHSDLSSRMLPADRARGEVSRIHRLADYQPTHTQQAVYAAGPDVRDVERRTGADIPTRVTHDAIAPVEHRVEQNTLPIYRPQVTRATAVPAVYREAGEQGISPLRDGDVWPVADAARHERNLESLPRREGSMFHPAMHEGGVAGRHGMPGGRR